MRAIVGTLGFVAVLLAFVHDADAHVKVKGSRVTIEGALVVIAAEVRKGEEVLALRDDSGVPRWAGWRRGGGRP